MGTIGVFLIKDNTPLYFKDGNIIWLIEGVWMNIFLFSFINANIQSYIKSGRVGTVGTYTIANAKTPILNQ